MAKSDPNLSVYGVIVIDEAYGMTTDVIILLGLLKRLAVKRKEDLKMIIISATINQDLFLEYFPGAKLEEVEGRQHEVLVEYLPTAPQNIYHSIVSAISQVAPNRAQ
jgi:HrpA-like RNA helicase